MDQHQQIVAVMNTLAGSAGSASDDELGALLDELAELLVRHAVREERGLLAMLGEVGVRDGYVSRFVHDHHHIDELVAAAKADHERIAAALDEVSHHIAIEENDTFPAAVQVLGPAEWDEIERAVALLT